MTTICVKSLKGGVGKSTSTACLSGEFAERGKSVLILDCDLNRPFAVWQASSSIPVSIEVAFIKTPAELRHAIALGEQEFDEIFIDLPAGGSEMSVTAVALADVVLIPFRAAPLDVAEAINTRRVCMEIATEFGVSPLVVCIPMALSAFSGHERITREALQRLRAEPDLVSTSGTTERTAYRQLFNPVNGATLYTLPETTTGIVPTRQRVASIVNELEDFYQRHLDSFANRMHFKIANTGA